MPSSGDQVKWSDTKAIGDLVDAVAQAMNIVAYAPLAQQDNTPFPLSGPISADFGYRFYMTGSPTDMSVTDNFIVTALGAPGSPEQYQMPNPTLAQLAADGNLYFVNAADGCWCNTIFQVTGESSPAVLTPGSQSWQLKQVGGDLDCCQSLYVPDVGDSLISGNPAVPSQYFIPSSYLSGYINTTYSGASPAWVYGPRCSGDGSANVDYKLVQNVDTPANWNVQAATRQMSGYFIWPVKADWYYDIIGNIEAIISGSCGAKSGMVYYRSTGLQVPEHCFPSFDDLCYTLGKNHPEYTSQPGCVTDPAGFESGCGAGAGSCPGQLMYANTLIQLEQLVSELTGQLYAFSYPCAACDSCHLSDHATVVLSGIAACPCGLTATNNWSFSGISGLDSVDLDWNDSINGYSATGVGNANLTYYDSNDCSSGSGNPLYPTDCSCENVDPSYPVAGTWTVTLICFTLSGVLLWSVGVTFVPNDAIATPGAYGSASGPADNMVPGTAICYNGSFSTSTAGLVVSIGGASATFY